MSKQYLFRVSILSKKSEHPLASCAYYCGESQFDVNNSKKYQSYTSDKVVWSNVVIPEKQTEEFFNLPDYLKFRTQKPDLISNARNLLWQKIDHREARADSQFARLFSLAVPHFLTQAEAIKLVINFGKVLVADGMIADCSLHSHSKKSNVLSLFDKIIKNDKEKTKETEPEALQDYNAYLMCTLRSYKSGQFQNKNRDWNSYHNMVTWRQQWVTFLSQAIEQASEATQEEKLQWAEKLSVYERIAQSKNTPDEWNQSKPQAA